ncbi:MAG TPA: CoA transferase [Candidatus Binataceae bacterium]|nr:CoA transferase [Candidatus Binataceae bacterium]
MAGGPLSGVTVIDLTHVLSGPFCTMLMAELGARVIKVEHKGKGDETRQFPPFVDGVSLYFAAINRGKESIALDFELRSDHELLFEMIRRGDVVVENLMYSTLERLGLDYDELQRINPRIIYGAIAGFGHSGPLKGRPAYDPIIQAISGMMSVNGQPDGPPTKVGVSMMDYVSGMLCLGGINAALYHREKTGRGMKVDIAMLDGQIAILEGALLHALNGMPHVGRLGNRHSCVTPANSYATADREIYLAAASDQLWKQMCVAMDAPALAADPRFDTAEHRHINQDAVDREIAAITKTRPADYWVEAMRKAGVPCARINTVEEAAAMPQVAARNMIVEADGIKMAGNPIKMSEFPDSASRQPAPALDADGARIRKEFATRAK